MITAIPDYHIHTKRCNHATGTMDEYVEAAISLGIREMGFADHMPVMLEPHLCMRWDELSGYIDEVHQLQDRYGDHIAIRLGAEMDMDLARTSDIADIIETYSFDYVIGSIHYLDGWPFDQEKYRDRFDTVDLDDLYGSFFEEIVAAARTGLYDIAGHIDNLKRMGNRPPGDLTPHYQCVAAELASMNLVYECNTGGLDHPIAETYPGPDFMRILHDAGVPVTLGSDAHRPEHVGRHFEQAVSLLRVAGYTSVTHFAEHKRVQMPFDSVYPS